MMSDLFHEIELALVEVFLTELGSKLKISKFKTPSKLCHKCQIFIDSLSHYRDYLQSIFNLRW